jgi:hypothetical protein
MVGRILYPFGVSFLLPIFVITLVKEKEDRILVMMRMVSYQFYYRVYHSSRKVRKTPNILTWSF